MPDVKVHVFIYTTMSRSSSWYCFVAVVTYSEHVGGAKDGVLLAIDEALNATNIPIRARLVAVNPDANASDLCGLLFDGTKVDLLIDTTLHSSEINRLARDARLPTITTNPNIEHWNDLSQAERKYLVQFQPPSSILARSMRDIVEHYRNNKYRILYDRAYGNC